MKNRLARCLAGVLVCCLAAVAHAQSILTVAGGGPIGDGKVATEAFLREPEDTAFDSEGNLYFTDARNHRVRRVDAKTGVITTVAGGGTSGLGDGGPATAAEVTNPSGLAIDREGNIYIGTFSGVRRVGRDGIITTYPSAENTIRNVIGMTFDADQNLYVGSGHQVLRIDRATRSITVVAGTGTAGFSGDGGPALAAQLDSVYDVAFDSKGNLYAAERGNHRVRRIDAATGIITSVAGNGINNGSFDPGTPATQTNFQWVESIAFDAGDNLYVGGGGHAKRVDAKSGIATYAGTPGLSRLGATRGLTFDRSGNLVFADRDLHLVQRMTGTDDPLTILAGGASFDSVAPALSAVLFLPRGLTVMPNGDVVFADSGSNRIRSLQASTGLVTTIAGTGDGRDGGEGGPASKASISSPRGLTHDAAGNLYFTTFSHTILRIDAASGILTRLAGRLATRPNEQLPPFSGDGGPATEATFRHPEGLAVDADGNVYVADSRNHRVRKIDAKTGIISTVAGSGPVDFEGPPGFAGDGGPATSARLNSPMDVAFDAAGNLYIADAGNQRIRRVDRNGIITSIAGSGRPGSPFGPALEVTLASLNAIHSDPSGNLWIGTCCDVRYYEASSGTVSQAAGSGPSGYSGDGGPALQARLGAKDVFVDGRRTLYISDEGNNRIRTVQQCVLVRGPNLHTPTDGATGLTTAPTLTWEKVDGAFRYDVFLSPAFPPTTLVASDITATSFTPSNLLPGTTYYWSVTAKGDPYCVPFFQNNSLFRSFTTAAGCDAPPAFTLTAPADGDATIGASVTLSWQASAGTATYDVLFGTTSPPPVISSTPATTLTVSGLTPSTTYSWGVVARASCDSSKVRATPIRTFRTVGACAPPGPFAVLAPPAGSANVSSTATLEWSSSPNASTYDLHLGTNNPPPLHSLDLTSTKITLASLTPGATYFWRVVARAGCDRTRTASTQIASFTVRATCTPPQATSFTYTPPSQVAAGQSYVVAWSDAANLEPGGYYVVERSTQPSFATILDAQETSATSASFIAPAPGTYHHRVRPVNPCPTGTGGSAQSKALSVVAAPPNVIFTVQPEAVLTRLGEKLEDKRTRFVIENIGTDTISVILARQEIDSVPFFTIADPFGGDSTFVTLEPRKPKPFEVRFSGPPDDKPASYQGVILLASIGKGLAITPYAFVSLRVGGGEAAVPQFRSGASRTEYAFFPGFAGDDSRRDPITVEIHNPGTTPMELGAEVGPEVWLVPEAGWNATAIAPGASRPVKLFTRRSRAPHGSALPRYTYFTVRTRSGLSARLLVQDNDVEPVDLGRGVALDPSSRSYVVPEIVSLDPRTFSTLRLTNIGSEPLQAELFFTPADADGFDAQRVRRATIVIPPNDIVALTDPLAQLWSLSRPARGQIEVRAPPERIGVLAVRANVTRAADDGGAYGYTVPALFRGEGARLSGGHAIHGVTVDEQTRAALVLAETSGADRVTARVSLFDADGNRRSERTLDLSRYGYVEIDEIATSITAGRITIEVTSGGGSVIGILKLLDRTTNGGATIVSELLAASTTTASRTRTNPKTKIQHPTSSAAAQSRFLPLVVSGPFAGQSFRTVVGLSASVAATRFTVTYRDGSANPRSTTVSLAAGRSLEYRDVLQELFAVTGASEGSLTIESDSPAAVHARLMSAGGSGRVSVSQALPVIGGDSEHVTSATSQRPLYLDGLEQSTDPTRGSRWMLLLNEIGGKASTIVLRLYEAGNRSSPIAEKEIALGSLTRVKLDNVFAALDLDSEQRRKDRTNVLLSVAMKGSGGIAAAMAMAIDNRTGDAKSFVLAPAGTTPGPVERVSAVAPVTAPGRRRAAGQ